MLMYKDIKLVPIEEEDIYLLNKWKNDEDIFKYLGGGYQPVSVSQQKKWIENLTNNTPTEKRFLIITNKGIKVGFIGLYNISIIHRTCSLGIYIGEKEYWGKEIASKAYKALEKYARNYLNLRKIKLEVVKNNKEAINLYQKLLFNVCGEFEKDRFIDGEYMNTVLMEKFI